MSKPVIVGAGLAGLTTALALAPMPVALVSPRILGEGCSSAWAQGGIAAAIGKEDSPTQHAADTLATGAALNDVTIVNQVTGDAHNVIEKLIALGVPFDRESNGDLRLGLEAAHKKRRIVHVADATGKAVMQSLIKAARATHSIEIIENATAQDLIADNSIKGIVLKRGDEQVSLPTGQVILATGGSAALWHDTTNPTENWGSGLALAVRAGATLADLEFMQFHPTAINIGRSPMPLASETLRGEGAFLIDENGARFTDELKGRDIVARAIWQKISEGHRVFLDARPIGKEFERRFPNIHTLCLGAGIDPLRDPIPIKPAAHYHMGGVRTDAQGRTDIDGLWACGEAACTGLHGANRLASNSLLEAASFGQRVADTIKGTTSPSLSGTSEKMLPAPPESHSDEIRMIMSDHVGVIRNHAGLSRAIECLSPLAAQSDMALTGLMIALCALRRTESRGAHFRSDFPETSPNAKRSEFHLSDLEDFR